MEGWRGLTRSHRHRVQGTNAKPLTLVDIPGHPRLRSKPPARRPDDCTAPCRSAAPALPHPHLAPVPSCPLSCPSPGKFDSYADRARGIVFLVDSVDFMPKRAAAAE